MARFTQEQLEAVGPAVAQLMRKRFLALKEGASIGAAEVGRRLPPYLTASQSLGPMVTVTSVVDFAGVTTVVDDGLRRLWPRVWKGRKARGRWAEQVRAELTTGIDDFLGIGKTYRVAPGTTMRVKVTFDFTNARIADENEGRTDESDVQATRNDTNYRQAQSATQTESHGPSPTVALNGVGFAQPVFVAVGVAGTVPVSTSSSALTSAQSAYHRVNSGPIGAMDLSGVTAEVVIEFIDDSETVLAAMPTVRQDELELSVSKNLAKADWSNPGGTSVTLSDDQRKLAGTLSSLVVVSGGRPAAGGRASQLLNVLTGAVRKRSWPVTNQLNSNRRLRQTLQAALRSPTATDGLRSRWGSVGQLGMKADLTELTEVTDLHGTGSETAKLWMYDMNTTALDASGSRSKGLEVAPLVAVTFGPVLAYAEVALGAGNSAGRTHAVEATVLKGREVKGPLKLYKAKVEVTTGAANSWGPLVFSRGGGNGTGPATVTYEEVYVLLSETDATLLLRPAGDLPTRTPAPVLAPETLRGERVGHVAVTGFTATEEIVNRVTGYLRGLPLGRLVNTMDLTAASAQPAKGRLSWNGRQAAGHLKTLLTEFSPAALAGQYGALSRSAKDPDTGIRQLGTGVSASLKLRGALYNTYVHVEVHDRGGPGSTQPTYSHSVLKPVGPSRGTGPLAGEGHFIDSVATSLESSAQDAGYLGFSLGGRNADPVPVGAAQTAFGAEAQFVVGSRRTASATTSADHGTFLTETGAEDVFTKTMNLGVTVTHYTRPRTWVRALIPGRWGRHLPKMGSTEIDINQSQALRLSVPSAFQENDHLTASVGQALDPNTPRTEVAYTRDLVAKFHAGQELAGPAAGTIAVPATPTIARWWGGGEVIGQPMSQVVRESLTANAVDSPNEVLLLPGSQALARLTGLLRRDKAKAAYRLFTDGGVRLDLLRYPRRTGTRRGTVIVAMRAVARPDPTGPKHDDDPVILQRLTGMGGEKPNRGSTSASKGSRSWLRLNLRPRALFNGAGSTTMSTAQTADRWHTRLQLGPRWAFTWRRRSDLTVSGGIERTAVTHTERNMYLVSAKLEQLVIQHSADTNTNIRGNESVTAHLFRGRNRVELVLDEEQVRALGLLTELDKAAFPAPFPAPPTASGSGVLDADPSSAKPEEWVPRLAPATDDTGTPWKLAVPATMPVPAPGPPADAAVAALGLGHLLDDIDLREALAARLHEEVGRFTLPSLGELFTNDQTVWRRLTTNRYQGLRRYLAKDLLADKMQAERTLTALSSPAIGQAHLDNILDGGWTLAAEQNFDGSRYELSLSAEVAAVDFEDVRADRETEYVTVGSQATGTGQSHSRSSGFDVSGRFAQGLPDDGRRVFQATGAVLDGVVNASQEHSEQDETSQRTATYQITYGVGAVIKASVEYRLVVTRDGEELFTIRHDPARPPEQSLSRTIRYLTPADDLIVESESQRLPPRHTSATRPVVVSPAQWLDVAALKAWRDSSSYKLPADWTPTGGLLNVERFKEAAELAFQKAGISADRRRLSEILTKESLQGNVRRMTTSGFKVPTKDPGWWLGGRAVDLEVHAKVDYAEIVNLTDSVRPEYLATTRTTHTATDSSGESVGSGLTLGTAPTETIVYVNDGAGGSPFAGDIAHGDGSAVALSGQTADVPYQRPVHQRNALVPLAMTFRMVLNAGLSNPPQVVVEFSAPLAEVARMHLPAALRLVGNPVVPVDLHSKLDVKRAAELKFQQSERDAYLAVGSVEQLARSKAEAPLRTLFDAARTAARNLATAEHDYLAADPADPTDQAAKLALYTAAKTAKDAADTALHQGIRDWTAASTDNDVVNKRAVAYTALAKAAQDKKAWFVAKREADEQIVDLVLRQRVAAMTRHLNPATADPSAAKQMFDLLPQETADLHIDVPGTPGVPAGTAARNAWLATVTDPLITVTPPGSGNLRLTIAPESYRRYTDPVTGVTMVVLDIDRLKELAGVAAP
ncbi:hypothetical protein O7632_13295 [Solwaraspora sp. WMMD406]|uniref:hypothetical protein n=1 Tax=Solwaraspora sp. WMMD406 TaxID=3016095 RepID=UPI002416D5C9|nr:hypothetical protein [Solwaraspora sp. WMMD406]MDG4765066.1 hypothetical protein [Solwaraspora sp. WMMD406]